MAKQMQLPKGFKPISGFGGSWDFKKERQIIGKIVSINTVKSKKYFDTVIGKNGKKTKVPKEQRVCELQTDNGMRSVWESASLSALFDLKKGAKVCVIYLGTKKIPGRDKPMKDFLVGAA